MHLPEGPRPRGWGALFPLRNGSRIRLQIPSNTVDFKPMKKKHTYNWLICLGLFMPKPELS